MGVKSAVPARLRITITPPYWKAWWFYCAAGGSVLLITWLLYRAKTNRIRSELRADREFSRQLIESQEAERKRVAGERVMHLLRQLFTGL